MRVRDTLETARSRRSCVLLASSASFFIGYLVLAIQGRLTDLDAWARGWALGFRSDALTAPMRLVTSLGEDVGLIPLILGTSLVLWPTCRRWAIALPVVMAGAGGVQALAKWAADRPRPDATAWGFPSGHVLTLVVLCGLIAYVMCAVSRRRRWHVVTAFTCAITVTVVGFTRLYLDRHWLSDLAGGFTIGLAYLLLVIWLVDVVCVPSQVVRRTGDDT